MKKLLFISLALVLLASLVAGGLTFTGCASGEAITDVVEIDSGYISGTVVGDPGNEVHVYRGIPYAEPPVGELRWQPPQPVTPWDGILECTELALWPAQGPGPWPPQEMSEDAALYLNVLTPAEETTDGLPVMVWFHGGGLTMLSGSQTQYNYPYLPQEGVVVVTVSMRLGVFGLMANPLLSEESENGVSGNYQFLDMLASLEWIQENIAAFGGDPDNVTIFGNSGGSFKCIALAASPLAEGLFDRFIGESGFPSATPLADLEAFGELLFDRLGVSTLEEARALSWEEILAADTALAGEMGLPWGLWGAAIDGYFLNDTPANTFAAGEQMQVPFIVGTSCGELYGPGLVLGGLISGYTELLSAAYEQGIDAYAYAFDQLPSNWKQEGCVTAHATEVMYIFGLVDVMSEWDFMYPFSYVPAGATQPDPGVTDVDRQVQADIMAMWVQFAKTGDPNVEGLIEWPTWEPSTDDYMYIVDPLEVRTGFSHLQD